VRSDAKRPLGTKGRRDLVRQSTVNSIHRQEPRRWKGRVPKCPGTGLKTTKKNRRGT